MALIRQCDRCKRQTPVDSINGRDHRCVRIETSGVTEVVHDLCRECITALKFWLTQPPAGPSASWSEK